jgi:hypothetical protein
VRDRIEGIHEAVPSTCHVVAGDCIAQGVRHVNRAVEVLNIERVIPRRHCRIGKTPGQPGGVEYVNRARGEVRRKKLVLCRGDREALVVGAGLREESFCGRPKRVGRLRGWRVATRQAPSGCPTWW